MAKFITGLELESAIYDVIWEAERTLLIVSPFIKLDDYFKKLFDKHLDNFKLHLIVVFGKNQDDLSKSLSKVDFDYFKQFPNVSIIYVPNLHAKYYGNENKGIITSLNLYDYSFKNNIEFGVYNEIKVFNNLTSSTDKEAWKTCIEMAETNLVVFIKRPAFKKKMLSSIFGKTYIKSEILHDSTSFYYSRNLNEQNLILKKTLNDFPDEIDLDTTLKERPVRENYNDLNQEKRNIKNNSDIIGFCIRTGVKIPFNPERPFCYDAYKVWNEYGDEYYRENYCHLTGEPSFGATSFNRPILSKNWRKSQALLKDKYN